jgi:undecaprenyl-diphosphatase
VLSTLVMVGLRAWLQLVGPLPGDEAVANRFPNPRTPQWFEQVAEFFDTLGTAGVAIATVAVLAWIVDRRVGRRRAIGVVLAAGAAAVNTLLKHAWGPTPLWDRITPEPGLNFPSGHVAYAAALFGFLAYLGLESRRIEVEVVCLLLAVGMGPSRLIDGSHLPSDVVAGYLFGSAWAIVVVLWVTRTRARAS